MTTSSRHHLHHSSILALAATLALAAQDRSRCQAFSSVVWTPQQQPQRQWQQEQKEQQRKRFHKQEEQQQQHQQQQQHDILPNLDTNFPPAAPATTTFKVQHRETYDLNAWFRGWHTVGIKGMND